MSLHAELSPEAQKILQAQKRNSTISSIVIALLAVVLVGLILGVFLLPNIIKETPVIVTYESNVVEETNLEQRKVQTNTQRKPSSPSSSMAKVITANTTSTTAIPTPDVDISTPSMDFGDGQDFGAGWGDGDGTGGGFGNIPATMKKRCSKEDRLARLEETGGTPACEDAVVKALDWLKNTQNTDGSWTGANQTAMTGLALLAYLGHCETPLSKDYGDTVLRAMTYLIDVGMKNKGKLSVNPANGQNFCYEQPIAAYALAEAATFCKQGNISVPNLFEVTQMAGQFIIDNQNKNGGWAYNYQKDGGHTDLSVSAWQIQALKACQHTGLEFEGLQRAAKKGLDYVDSVRCDDGGFGYDAPNKSVGAYRSLAGAGLLCLQMFDKGSSASARGAARYIEKNTKFEYKGEHSNLYAHYYEAQAMMNRGGTQWKKYNAIFRDQLLKNQNPDGSWPEPGHKGHGDNMHYRTCLNTLMLEVYYRFLPGTGSK